MARQQQQQHIQLAPPSSGSPAANSSPNDADGARLVQMCPSLYRTAYGGRTEEVMALLLQRHGAERYQSTGIVQHGQCDILEVSAERNTVLHVAAEQGHDELILELYLRFREEQGLLSRRNSSLDTPLHCAARAGHVRAVAVLVQLAGQDFGESILGCKNEAGDTALHLAARHGHGDAVEVLVSAAAGPAGELNNAGVSPLYLAVMSGSVQAVRAIVSTCSEASAVGPSSQNALHAAVFQSSEMVEMLLEWRPALADEVDSGGSSPLHFAASDGDRKIVEAILRAGPPGTVYRKDSGGLSALHVAARMGHDSVVKAVLRSCPDAAELRGGDGGTFVHAAARAKRSKVVSLAVKNPVLHGLLDAQDRDGNTPLHLAVGAGAPGVVETLLWVGKVRTDVLNNLGRTAFDLVVGSTSFFTMVKLVVTLVAFKAQLRPQRHDRLTPWSDHYILEKMGKTSDSLAVVAVLIATAAFTAGFNVPGGYGDTGEANLAKKPAFKAFVFLLVYGKVSRSASSWKSFALALQLMWVSLVTLFLAFYAALVAVVTTRAVRYGFVVVLACMFVLQLRIGAWIGTDWPTICTIWRFIWQRCHSKGRHGIKRLYPLVCASVVHHFLFAAISFISFFCFGAFTGPAVASPFTSSPASAPSPL
ncbi:protein ACCELERATED CELL DEATH 6 isoform X2 [Setaria italica]|uniref:protein ACCELERATED CELL DEATH 6 isoform X2 n=1 Tax=Setaria italica TaxID=4555 RepID=UPI000BE5917B|nr:protein ACCELERATED CELL DEATH 6 isoform X2 [Setaria italica]